jgi:hypothetical protein
MPVALLCAILCCTATVLPGHERPAPSHLVRDRAVCLMRRVSPASAMQETHFCVGQRDARLPSAAAPAMCRLRGGGRWSDTAGGEQGVGMSGEIGPLGVAGSAVRGRTRAGRQAMGNHTGSTAARKGSSSMMLREEEDRHLRQVSVRAHPRVYLHECDRGLGVARVVGPCYHGIRRAMRGVMFISCFVCMALPTSIATYVCRMLMSIARAYLSGYVPVPACADRHNTASVYHTRRLTCVHVCDMTAVRVT